jgi:hypothetical protein
MLTENYRGITITSVHGKVFEYVLLEKTTIAKDGQSNMQFGFTDGLSPNMAALIKLDVFCCNTVLVSRFSAVQLLYGLFYFFDGYNYFLFLFRF